MEKQYPPYQQPTTGVDNETMLAKADQSLNGSKKATVIVVLTVVAVAVAVYFIVKKVKR